jgi:hypothetical protein
LKQQIKKIKDWYNEEEIINELVCRYYPNKHKLRNKNPYFTGIGIVILSIFAVINAPFGKSFFFDSILIILFVVVFGGFLIIDNITHSHFYQVEDSEKEDKG